MYGCSKYYLKLNPKELADNLEKILDELKLYKEVQSSWSRIY
jgi:hypothetical protein